jgi:hypothetical protein
MGTPRASDREPRQRRGVHASGDHPRKAGARGGALALALVLAVLSGRQAAAADAPPVHLLLPLLTTVALGRSIADKPFDRGAMRYLESLRGMRATPTLLPRFLWIPDLYAVDVADRDPRRFAEPVDRDTYFKLNLLPSSLSESRALSVVYDRESLPALGASSNMLRLELRLDF